MQTSEDAGLVPLVGAIYEAALAAQKWPVFLSRFALHFRSEQALMWAHDFSDHSAAVFGGPTALASTVGLDEHYHDGYLQHFCHHNVWVANEHLHQEGQLVNSSTLFPDGKLGGTEWFGDWLRPQGLFYSFAAVVEKRHHRSFNLTALRAKRHGSYDAREMRQLRSLVPHLQTAFALHRRLHRAEALAQASLELLDRLPLGIVLLDERADVLHANSRAHGLARESGLIQIGRRFHENDELHIVNHAEDLRLQVYMRRVVSTGIGLPLHSGQGMRLRGLRKDLHLLITPLPQRSEPFGSLAAAAVLISDPTSTLLRLDAVLCHCYGLTPAEALLAQALVAGSSLKEYAIERGLSVHTVRAQLKSVTSKVGARRQSDLVRIILNGPAMLQWTASGQRP